MHLAPAMGRPRPRRGPRLAPALTMAAALCVLAPGALALQPLGTFVDAAARFHPDNREAAAQAASREAAVAQTRGRLLPSVSARAGYTWNQREVAPDFGGSRLLITPRHGLDALFQLDIPLVDVSGWQQVAAAKASAEAAQALRAGTRLAVDEAVARAWYQVVAAEAVRSVAETNLQVAGELLAVANQRFEHDAAPELEVRRAEANVARAQQSLAEARLAATLAGRRLQSLTGVVPEPVASFPTDDLHAEPPLDHFLAQVPRSPRLRSAAAREEAARHDATAHELLFVPTVAAQAAERLTNATGFIDESSYATVGVALTWRFDFSHLAARDVAAAGVDAAQAGTTRARLSVQDDIFEAWHRVGAAIERSRAARVEALAATDAAAMAALRYHEGAGTQLDVVTAQRDQFAAEVGRVQADTELGFAREYLRLATTF
ncbi:MAG: TolC family protein [Deltaproteobacteria bacterium]|nr:TolC family protein [Deltaproteobacteria bacterium]MCB9789082.1 TolC family protein [Deltaproteobacteria bacterium]